MDVLTELSRVYIRALMAAVILAVEEKVYKICNEDNSIALI